MNHTLIPQRLAFSVGIYIALSASNLWAHGEAVLCDNRLDLVEQCGEVHDCVIDSAVSEHIGYCKAEAEDISFVICDREAEVSTCDEGEVCKIGTIDSQIGVCAELEEPMETDDHDDHDHEGHDDHDHGDHDDHDHDHGGCQSDPHSPSSFSLISLISLIILLGLTLTRRRRQCH